MLEDLAAVGGVPDADFYHLAQKPHSSYEVLVDATSGDIGPTLDVQRMAPDGTTVLQDSLPIGAGLQPQPALGQHHRGERSGRDGPREQRRVRHGLRSRRRVPGPRLRDDLLDPALQQRGTQITILVMQNPTNYPINATVYFWDTAGTQIGSTAVTLAPKAVTVLNTATVAPGVGGAVTVAHDGRYGDLAGKTVALEPATGFSFDSPMLPRVKMN